jgi:hypothetical protein
VADDDCTAHVTNAPVIIPENLLDVIRANTWRNPAPANFCSASLIIFIPKINRASEPNSFNAMLIVIESVFYAAKILSNLHNHHKMLLHIG